MSFSSAISTCMDKYANFHGRASRSEYWWFNLFALLMIWGAELIGAVTFPDDPVLSQIVPMIINLAISLPLFAAGSRRLHDIGKSGWWQLLVLTFVGVILLYIWFAFKSQDKSNKYGEIPKDKVVA